MKKILIIGAGFLQDFVIQKAKNMGYTTLAVDANPDAVGFSHADGHAVINIVDEKSCLAYAKKENIDGVLTAATDFGVLTAAYIARELKLPGLPYESALTIKNKYLVRKCLFDHHVDDTEQAYEVNASTDLKMLSKILHYPVMVKPCDGSGSRGTSRVDQPEQLKAACKFAMDGSITHRAEIETFVHGKEYGIESLVADGNVHVLGIMKKWMTQPPYYAELGHALPNDLSPDTEQKARECAEHAIKALGITFGSVNMDVMITPEGTVHIVDIGARMGGNMIGPCLIPYGTGVDYMGNMIRNAVGDPLDWSVQPHGAVASKLLAFAGGTVESLSDTEAFEKENHVELYHHMQAGDTFNEYHTNLDGCGYVIARGKNTEQAEKTAAEALQEISHYIFKMVEG